MQNVLKLSTVLAVTVAICTVMVTTAPQKADARPLYYKEFGLKYKNLLQQAKKAKCNVGHIPKQPKEKHNIYGEALEKAFDGKKNLKDAKQIAKALEKAEKAKSAVEGKTFGDLIKEGKLPASKE